MEARPESQEDLPASNSSPPPAQAGGPAQAVEQILARTEAAIAEIESRTEEQVQRICSDVEARAAEEALARRAQLEQVHRELADRSAALIAAYEGIHQRLAEINAALADSAAADQRESGHGTAAEQQSTVPAKTMPDRPRARPRRWLPWRRAAA